MKDASRGTPAAILFAMLTAGCGSGALGPPVSGPAAPPPAGPPDALRASFSLRLDTGSGSRRFEGALALAAPDRLYVELAGPLGGIRAVMAVRGARVLVLFPGTKEFIDEEATAATFESLLGLRLDTESLIELIRFGRDGACATASCTKRVPMAADPDGASRVLIVSWRDDRVGVRLEDEAAGPEGLRSLELRLSDAQASGPDEIASALFAPAVPDGWTRVRPQACAACGALLRAR